MPLMHPAAAHRGAAAAALAPLQAYPRDTSCRHIMIMIMGVLLQLLLELPAAAAAGGGSAGGLSAPSSETAFRLAYSAFHEPSNTEIRTATGDTAPGHEEQVDILIELNGGDRGAGQLALAPNGSVLAYCSFCEGCATPMGGTGGWELNTSDVPSQGAASPDSQRRVAVLDGGAGFAGQPAWAPDGSALAFVTEGKEGVGGSFWNITVATVGGTLRLVDTVFVPKSYAPDTNLVQCVRPTWVSATRLVYAGWLEEAGTPGRLWSTDIRGGSPPLSLVRATNNTEFCRPVAAPLLGASNGSIAVSAFDSSSETWTAEILRPAPASCGTTPCNTDADCTPDAAGTHRGLTPAGCGVCIHTVQHPSTYGPMLVPWPWWMVLLHADTAADSPVACRCMWLGETEPVPAAAGCDCIWRAVANFWRARRWAAAVAATGWRWEAEATGSNLLQGPGTFG